jgi:hypothetical protein
LLHHAGGEALAESPEIFRHVFGSFSAPVLYSRFAVEVPASVNVRISSDVGTASSPSLHSERRDGMVIYRWEASDVAQSLLESSMPAEANLPAVALLPAYADWDEVRDHYRELAFEAAGAGTEVQAGLTALHPERAATEEELGRRIAAYVQKNVAISDADAFVSGDVPSAEDSLANGEGSRTVAALALAHAAGLDVGIILARSANSSGAAEISLQTFTKPLLGFAFHGKSGDRMVFADVETQGLAFGALPPEIATGDALSIPLARPRAGSALVALRVPPAREENFADADIRVTATGDADARLDIRMGSFRGAQMRATLRNLRGAARQQFYEQIALRIFPGALSVTGTVRHEDDTDRPLALELRCRVPGFVNFARLALEDSIDIDQLVPALGLKRMYATQTSRKFALAIELPLFESTTFRLHLPAGLAMPQSARDVRLATNFGDYVLEFRQPDARTIEVRRSFRIPVQTVSASAYAEFARFAQQIEDAERQRLTLARASGSVAAASGGK